MEIFLWLAVGAYLVAASYALAENLSCKHTLTRGWLAKARVAWEAVIWPLEVSSWELPQLCWRRTRTAWAAALPRYQEVPW